MKKFLNSADKFTQYAVAAVLTLFAVACMFSGCVATNGEDFEPIPPVMINSTAKAAQEETRPEFLDMGTFRITPYCACKKCCGNSADGITATGTRATAGRTISVDEDVIPFGAEVIINGHTYIAEDNAVNAIIGKEVSIFFDTHEEVEEFGVRYANVYLLVGDTNVYNK